VLLVRGRSLDSALEKFGMDPQFGPEVQQALEASGIELRFNTEVEPGSFTVPSSLSAPIRLRLRPGSSAPAPCNDGPETLECDLYMLAAGRDANTQRLHLEAVGATTDKRGALVVDRNLCAVEGCVWGAGDVLGPPSLASTGVQQATAAIQSMFARTDQQSAPNDDVADFRPSALIGSPFRYPVGVWTTPEMAYYGQSPRQAAAMGTDAVQGVARYADTLRGHVNRCRIGSLKLVVDARDGTIVGIFIFGDEACELVHYGMELVASERTVFDVRSTMFAAVTFHELFANAAEDAIAKLKERGSGAEVVASLARG
jgi:pyruvate/2-oxoglutarate dehydrogenase complex dihydrolipoamide dehydrogenase (E3) component